jgi:glutathione S-transferase
MELLGSQGLIRLAWLHRWLFEENHRFVKMDFGRSFRPQGNDEELLKYGDLIADRMMSYGLPESTPEARGALDDQYRELLQQFEAHWIEHPDLLGGHPSAADYALMGALHAHMGRDPAGLRVMQNHAPRTFRWVEHMLVPDVQSPEFGDRPVSYPTNDAVPETALEILRFIALRFGDAFVLDSLAFQQAMARQGVATGHELAPDNDQPILERERVHFRGADHNHAADLHTVWVAQRAQRHFQAQSEGDRERIREMLGDSTARELLEVPVTYSIERRNNRLLIGPVDPSNA